MQQHESQLVIGDWVKGKTKNGELIRGFVETLDAVHGTTKVYVIDCDHEVTIGRTVETLTRWVKKVPETAVNYEEQLRDLIDIALLTRDEPWFKELSQRLTVVKKGSLGSDPTIKLDLSFRNHLGSNNL